MIIYDFVGEIVLKFCRLDLIFSFLYSAIYTYLLIPPSDFLVRLYFIL